jgi:hypothetical protein
MRLVVFYYCIFILGLAGNCAFSQVNDTVTVPHQKRSIKPTTDFDQRFSSIRDTRVNIWGQRFGILINEKFKIGVGGYFLNDKLKNKIIYEGDSYIKRNLTFATAYIEPFLIRKTYYEFSIPFEAGFGKAHSRIFNSETNSFIVSEKNFFFPSGTGLSLSLKFPAIRGFKPLSWIGINFLAGYRYDFFESIFKTDFDGPFFSISGAIFLDRISDDYKAHKEKKKEKVGNQP